MFKDYPDVMTIAQVAKALGIGLKAAYGLVNRQVLGYIPIGRRKLVPKEMLVEYVRTARNNIKL